MTTKEILLAAADTLEARGSSECVWSAIDKAAGGAAGTFRDLSDEERAALRLLCARFEIPANDPRGDYDAIWDWYDAPFLAELDGGEDAIERKEAAQRARAREVAGYLRELAEVAA